MTAVNHKVSKDLVKFATDNGVSVIGMEDLTGIRDRNGCKVSKVFRYQHSSWAFRQLQSFVEYKANEAGIAILYVNPEYTSQPCPRCNLICRNNRHGVSFPMRKMWLLDPCRQSRCDEYRASNTRLQVYPRVPGQHSQPARRDKTFCVVASRALKDAVVDLWSI